MDHLVEDTLLRIYAREDSQILTESKVTSYINRVQPELAKRTFDDFLSAIQRKDYKKAERIIQKVPVFNLEDINSEAKKLGPTYDKINNASQQVLQNSVTELPDLEAVTLAGLISLFSMSTDNPIKTSKKMVISSVSKLRSISTESLPGSIIYIASVIANWILEHPKITISINIASIILILAFLSWYIHSRKQRKDLRTSEEI